MNEEKFTLICNNCGTKVELKEHSYLKEILISGTVYFSPDITITCQNCDNSVELK